MAWPGPVWKRETMRSPRWTWQSNAQQCFQGAVFESWFSGSVMLANAPTVSGVFFPLFSKLGPDVCRVGQKIKFFPHQVVLFILKQSSFCLHDECSFFLFKRCAFRTYVMYKHVWFLICFLILFHTFSQFRGMNKWSCHQLQTTKPNLQSRSTEICMYIIYIYIM